MELSTTTLQSLLSTLTSELDLDRPSVSTDGGAVLYLTSMHAQYAAQLQQTLEQLHIDRGHMLRINDHSGKSIRALIL